MRTGPCQRLTRGRALPIPPQLFSIFPGCCQHGLWGASGPLRRKMMRYLGDRLRHGERVRRRPCFIQMVHAPHRGSFFVPRCSAVFDVQIAYTQYRRGHRQVRANFRPELRPVVEGGGKERKSGFRHVLMLWRKILSNDRELPWQPLLENGTSL